MVKACYSRSGKAKMLLEKDIVKVLTDKGAGFVYFVDISQLPKEKTRGYSNAILFGLVLSPSYISEVADTPDYVKRRVENNFDFDDDEYHNTELGADALADYLADYLREKGYSAFSQSDKSQIEEGLFDGVYKETLLPHKTIAGLAGLGWIGKNNLLVTPQFGCALCLGTVLTDAPVKGIKRAAILPKCGGCKVCENICDTKALKGYTWSADSKRDDIISIFECTTCIKCMVHCPWTQRYIKQSAR